MYKISDDTKKLIWNIGNNVFVNYVITFPNLGITLDNDTIHEESIIWKQSICEEADLEFGGCIASSFEFEAAELSNVSLKGAMFQVTMQFVDKDDNLLTQEEIPIGTFKVDTATKVDDQDYRKIIAYDQMHDAMDDVAEWYESYFPVLKTETRIIKDDDGNEVTEEVKVYDVVSLQKFREALLDQLGIPYEKQRDLTNNGISVKKTISTNGGTLSGQKLLKMICEIQGGFGVINRYGRFEIITLKNRGLWPEETLYPDEMLWPEDSFQYIGQNGEETKYPEFIKATYEDYSCQYISGIRFSSNTLTRTFGATENLYIMAENYFLYGQDERALNGMYQSLRDVYGNVTYQPADITLKALPYLDVGDCIALEKERDDIFTIVLSRTMSGIQGMQDEYVATGNEYRDNVVNDSTDQNYDDQTGTTEKNSIDITNGSVHIETRYDSDDEIVFHYKDQSTYSDLIANREGFSHSDYEKKTYQIDNGEGKLVDVDLKEGNSGSYKADGITLQKDIISTRMGNATSSSIEGNIALNHYKDSEDFEPVGRLESDIDFYAPNLENAIIAAEVYEETTSEDLKNGQTLVGQTDVSQDGLIPVAVFLQSAGGYCNCYGLELDTINNLVTYKIINISGATHSGGVVFVVLYRKDWGAEES